MTFYGLKHKLIFPCAWDILILDIIKFLDGEKVRLRLYPHYSLVWMKIAIPTTWWAKIVIPTMWWMEIVIHTT